MNNNKALIALALVALIGIVGGTYAYFTSTSTLNNSFKTGTYATSVTEEFVSPTNWVPGTVTQKKVNVTNKGTVSIVARASYTESWTAADGTSLSLTRNGDPIAQFEIGSDWVQEGNYYYYNKVLGQNATSTDFLEDVTFNPEFELLEGTDIHCETVGTVGQGTAEVKCSNLRSGYAGATYTLNITIETIQSDRAWNSIAQ